MVSSVELSVVIPVYCSADVVENTVAEIDACVSPWCERYEIVLVNDGSQDGSSEVISRLAAGASHICAINLARNFGQHNAIMAGLKEAQGERIVIVDDDGQHDPVYIRDMCRELDAGADVVYVRYESKIDPIYKNLGSWLNDRMAVHLLAKPPQLYLSSYKAISRMLCDECIRYGGPFVYLDGIILRATQHIAIIPAVHRAAAKAKGTTYSLGKLFSLWLNMFTNFSIAPLRVIFLLGIYVGLIAFAAIVGMVVLFASDPSYYPRGWTTTFVLILLFGSFQLLAIGLVGEYVGRILLLLNQRPQYVVKDRE